MQNLLLIGASNFLAQELINQISAKVQVVAVAIEEDTDRHREFLQLKRANLHPEILDITQGGLSWLDKLIEKYGHFDAVLYFPCENAKKSYLEITSEDFDRAAYLNGKLPFLISQKLVPGMQQLSGGRFVFIGTIWSIKGHPDHGQDYAITKVMQNQLAKQITAAFVGDNITATTVIFGSVNLHQTSRAEKPLFTDDDRVISHPELTGHILSLLDKEKRSFAGATVLLDNGTLSIAGV